MAEAVSLGAIVRANSGELLATRSITPAQFKVLRSIADCRTEALGGHRDRCDHCAHERVFWNSCRDRHCPGCGAEARQSWLEKRRQEVLDVPYFHVVFTIPECLNALASHAPAIIYAILLRAAGQALLHVARSKLRAILGVLTVLHTWGQTLFFHPHIHCVVPGGGFSLDGRRWVHVPTGTFLLHHRVISRRFRTLVKNAITQAYDDGTLILPRHIAADRQALDLLLVRASKTDWHSYVKPPFGGPEQVLAYLAAYTHRVAISNRRLLALDDNRVTFAYRDYKDGNANKTMELPATEFLHRFIQHIVPSRFTRIRYYGYLSNRDRSVNIERARALIASTRKLRPRDPAPDPRRCPQCQKGTMRVGPRVNPLRPRTWFDSS
jgi:Putative transposase/Transposase zinc-binding domain